jgi:sugar phosphate permease
VWWSLRDVGKDAGPEQHRPLAAQFSATKEVIKNPVILALVMAAAVRGVGLNAIFHWTPFYLEKELSLGHFSTGVHMALLTGMGIASAPFLGSISDRFGRKKVLVPGLFAASGLLLLVVSAGDSVLLALIMAGVGLFSFALQQIILAAVLDIAGRGTEATTTGFIFGLNGIIGGVSPFLATVIIAHLGGYGSIFYYAGILTAAAGLLVWLTPLKPQDPSPSPQV